jgi:hypothetical protein
MSQTFVNDDCKAILDFYYQFNKSDLSGTEHAIKMLQINEEMYSKCVKKRI